MPLFNKTFTSGKMNKDADERTVPNGEYRDAVNIEVQTSNHSEVGTAQSLLGNTLISDQLVPVGSTCVGSIADNKNDKIYYLVAGPEPSDIDFDWNASKAWKDYIIEYDVKTETFKYVFVDIYKANYKVITGGSASSFENKDRITIGIDYTSNNPYTHIRRNMIVDVYDNDGNHYIDGSALKGNTTVIERESNGDLTIFSNFHNFFSTSISSNSWVNLSADRILNFHKDRYITGINIIDGMLFWTDNHTEPKKINIERCIGGTGGSTYLTSTGYGVFDGDNANFHTRLCIPPDKNNSLTVKPRKWDEASLEGEPWFVKEENITVIRKGPLSAPQLLMSRHDDDRRDKENNRVTVFTTCNSPAHISAIPTTDQNSFSYQASNGYNYIKNPGDFIENVYVQDPVFWLKGDTILFNQNQDETVTAFGFTEHDVRGRVEQSPCDSSDMSSTGPFRFLIESIDKESIDEEQKVWNLRLEEEQPMFEMKFARFAYRYKYEDGEYSQFSPWSEPAFLPGQFDYLPKKAYNLGMTIDLEV